MSWDSLFEAVGTAAEVYGTIKTGQQTKKIADENAAIAQADAEQKKKQAVYEAAKQREENQRLLSRQRLLFAKAGVRIDEGSPLLFLSQQESEMEEEAHNIELGGEVEYAKGMNKARLYSIQGRQAVETSNVGAVGTILKGGIRSYGISTKKELKARDYYDA
jgi:hypothetical protein